MTVVLLIFQYIQLMNILLRNILLRNVFQQEIFCKDILIQSFASFALFSLTIYLSFPVEHVALSRLAMCKMPSLNLSKFKHDQTLLQLNVEC